MRIADQTPKEIRVDVEINTQIMRDAQVAAEADLTNPSRWYFGIPKVEPMEQDQEGDYKC